MKPAEFRAKLADIIAKHDDQGAISTICSELTDDYEGLTTQQTAALASAEQLKKDNESLRQANMSLFLKIGQEQPPATEKQNEPETLPDYESYFDAKGNFK